ncbi:DUF7004 family protein [Beggiatoa leptomitoformis]|uniref:Uncharacterized protein n=1 Tax=Beggiatoa leptomitoformis TaxID=288004 RepID=A0A2N9YAX5_9GAMM|nr:hypothetical protein [Beggiatoa leptomitoformis]ALG67028.1 hypothetical protein AL038_03970 [Beggiatoa leptomitoformis]AUI67594.1 hypothetical protein BLE401_02040 [Beggiatoa leptomitoformis]
MQRLIQTFNDGSTVAFDSGRFDDWCVYLHRPAQRRYAPSDTYYFARLQILGKLYGFQSLYDDYIAIYEKTNAQINPDVLSLILQLTEKYQVDSLEIAIWFTVIYAGMVAEENKQGAILKKRIKRLGMHQTLIEQIAPNIAANYSRGKKWRELDVLCKEKGF